MRWAAIVLLAVSTVAAAGEPAAGEGVCNVQGKTANLSFTLKDIGGDDVQLSSFKGRVILLDFWATWCAPCRTEIPQLVELDRKYRQKGFVVLGVSIDDPLSRLEPFVAELGMSYPVLIGAGRDDLKNAFGPIYGVPTSFLIARDGTICMRHTGADGKKALERELLTLL